MDYGLDTKSTRLKTFNTIFIITWLLIACFPFIWTFWGAFKVRADFFSRSDWWYAISAFNTLIETGGKFTTNAYTQAWTEGEFWKASKNTIIVTVFVVSISLFLGTLGAYALSRSTEKYAFWILMVALIFRAMPHITLVSGYLFPFFELQIWGILPTKNPISWEGHLSGFLAGIVVAIFYKNKGPKRKKYQWEIDEELEEELKNSTTRFHYTLKDKNKPS